MLDRVMPYPNSEDIPVTQKLLNERTQEVKSLVVSNSLQIKAVDSKVENLGQQIGLLDQKVDSKTEALDKKIDSKIETLDQKIDSKIEALDKKIDSKVEVLEQKIDRLEGSMDYKFKTLEAKMDSRFEEMMSVIHKNNALVEEQNSRNRVVLDALVGISERFDRTERENNERFECIEAAIQSQ